MKAQLIHLSNNLKLTEIKHQLWPSIMYELTGYTVLALDLDHAEIDSTLTEWAHYDIDMSNGGGIRAENVQGSYDPWSPMQITQGVKLKDTC